MESAKASVVRYVIHTKVIDVRERIREQFIWGSNPVAFEKVSLGYFALFEGSHEALHLGYEPPEIAVGDTIKITFEKVTPCPPSTPMSPATSSSSSSSATPK